jgi:hypothetical protein
MRVQQSQLKFSARGKLALLAALIAPAAVHGDESVRPVTPLVPLASELGIQNELRPAVGGEQSSVLKLTGPSAALLGDGWAPRVPGANRVSPLVIDSTRGRPDSGHPLSQVMASGDLVSGPLSVSVSSGATASPLEDDAADDAADADQMPSGIDGKTDGPAIKVGVSASSTIKILPNIIAPILRSVGIQPNATGDVELGDGLQASSDSRGPSGGAQATSAASDQVDNPEQNEPSGAVAVGSNGEAEGDSDDQAEGVVPELAELSSEPEDEDSGSGLMADVESGDERTEGSPEAVSSVGDVPVESPDQSSQETPAPMEIRKLRLRDGQSEDLSTEAAPSRSDVGDGDASGSESADRRNAVKLSPLDPKIAGQRVGDFEVNNAGEYGSPSAERVVQSLPRNTKPVSKSPIQGDRITEAGELILASGPSAAKLSLTPATMRLKPMIQQTLRYYWDRPEDSAQRTHWGMMHSIMVFDRDTQIINQRQRYNAVAWMAGNNPCRNQTLFTRDQHGILPKTGVGLQGHQAQLLAIFGLINVPLDYPVYASKQKYTVHDILLREMQDCKVKSELTFTLIGLAHYADSDAKWVAGDGQDWTVPRVIQEELAQPIIGAACGGTHRLMGFGHALRRRHAEGKPIDGQWARADQYIKDYVNYTWSLQNRDGSMSTAWYERPEDNGNMDRKIQTTGHMLEMLLTVTPDADLQSPQMLRTVNYMASTLYNERGHEWQVGPKGHALRSLAMYYQRVFGGSTPWRQDAGARSAGQPVNRSVR